jgi:flagellar export protein FliJ
MAKFVFSMATLLRLREAARDDRRAELAEALRAHETLGQWIDQANREVDRLHGACRQVAGPGTVDVDRLAAAQRYELLLRAKLQQLHAQRERLTPEIERRRQALVHANRDVRVLEKLRENQHQRYQAEGERRQVRILDEVAQMRALGEDDR